MSKCHIVRNLMHWLIYIMCTQWPMNDSWGGCFLLFDFIVANNVDPNQTLLNVDHELDP